MFLRSSILTILCKPKNESPMNTFMLQLLIMINQQSVRYSQQLPPPTKKKKKGMEKKIIEASDCKAKRNSTYTNILNVNIQRYKSISEPTCITEYLSKLFRPDFRVRVWPFPRIVQEP